MKPSTDGTDEDGYVLVEVLVAVAILLIAGTVIYETGNALLSRSAYDLDRSAALSNLHTIALVLGVEGRPAALSSLPSEDQLFRYEFTHPPKPEVLSSGAASRFSWVEIQAVSRASGLTVASVTTGFDG